MGSLRRLLAKQEDPYAGAEMSSALRLGSVTWGIFAFITVVLCAFSPPDGIEVWGWVIAIGLIGVEVGLVVEMRRPRIPWTFDMLLGTSYFGLVSIVVLQALAGGVGAPYEMLLLLPVIYTATIHPPRKILVLLLLSGVGLAAPYVYDGWNSDAFAGTFASYVLDVALAFSSYLLMSGVRAQRLALRHDEAEAREEARQDGLTTIGNRRAFEEAIQDELARANRMGTELSVLMADIEQFKSVNDSFGHLEGDEILCRVAETMQSDLRVPDRVFRWGGDEFVLLLPGTAAHGADALAERLRNLVNVRCRRPDGEPILVRFGSAELCEGMSATDLVEQADLALLGVRAAR